MDTLKIAGSNQPDMPWEDRPAGSKEVMWRYTQNPIIGRHALSTSNSIFNSAVVPFKKGKYNYAGVFRCDDTNRRMRIHVGFSVDGLRWEIEESDFRLEGADADIYVTGSNSKLMSSEISTYLTGRYVSIPVYTLSFKEYLAFKQDSPLSRRELLEEYIRFGGFPIIALSEYDEQSAYQIVNGIYHTVVSRDIVKRHRINKQDLFDRVVKFIIENVGKTFSANSISTFLKSEHRKVSVESIYNYLRWLEQAFIIYPCERYDLQGKSILKTQEKYYLADVSLKYALLAYNRKMLDGAMENIVYLELKRRGYDVYIGKNDTKEIDFVATRRDERIYVQVCVRIPEASDREVGNLMEIRDHYPKYVVTLNEMDTGIEDGIRIVHLADFLLAEQW